MRLDQPSERIRIQFTEFKNKEEKEQKRDRRREAEVQV